MCKMNPRRRFVEWDVRSEPRLLSSQPLGAVDRQLSFCAMKIISTQPGPDASELVEKVQDAWISHPLRSSQVDKRLENVTIDVVMGDRFGVNSDRYPLIQLNVGRNAEVDMVALEPALVHELTHLIDRHDPKFIEDRSIPEAAATINDIPQGNVNESVLHAFHTYWNAYIDGRLARAGIVVDTFERRLEEKLGSRRGTEFATVKEIESLRLIWDTEPHTLDELIDLAMKYPAKRPPHLRVVYPDNGGSEGNADE